MYKLLANAISGANQVILRLTDNAFIPADPANTDYAAYQNWLAAGNKPLPADPPPSPDPKVVGVAFNGVMCSATKDDQNGLVAVLLAYQLQGQNFAPTEFLFSNGSKLVLTAQNMQSFIAVWMPFRQSFFKP